MLLNIIKLTASPCGTLLEMLSFQGDFPSAVIFKNCFSVSLILLLWALLILNSTILIIFF